MTNKVIAANAIEFIVHTLSAAPKDITRAAIRGS